MNLAVSNIAWGADKDLEMYQFIKDAGFSGIEIAPTRLFSDYPSADLLKVAEFSSFLWKQYELTIPSIQSIWFGRNENLFKNTDERDFLVSYTKKTIDFAVAAGSKNIVFGCPRNRQLIGDDDSTIYPFLKSLGDYMIGRDVAFSIEPNPVIYNTNFINKTEQAFKLVKTVNCNKILVNLDVGTIIYNDESINLIADNIKLVNHIHISEPYLEIIKKRNLHRELASMLKEKGYYRYISIEMKKTEVLDDVKNSIEYIRGLFL